MVVLYDSWFSFCCHQDLCNAGRQYSLAIILEKFYSNVWDGGCSKVANQKDKLTILNYKSNETILAKTINLYVQENGRWVKYKESEMYKKKKQEEENESWLQKWIYEK